MRGQLSSRTRSRSGCLTASPPTPPWHPGPKALELGMAVAVEDVLRVKCSVQRSPMFFLRERSYDPSAEAQTFRDCDTPRRQQEQKQTSNGFRRSTAACVRACVCLCV